MGSASDLHHPFSAPSSTLPLDDNDDDVMDSVLLSDSITTTTTTTTSSSNSNNNDPPFFSSHSHTSPSASPSNSSLLLEPPSYADLVFSPSLPHPSPRSSHIHTHISVSDPQTELDPSPTSIVPSASSFTTYLVSSSSSGHDYRVRRRFREVVTLADRLADSQRGLFVPLRPDKAVVEGQVMQRQEFVEQRRASIERYLRRLAAHPVVGGSEELRIFLQAEGRLPLPTTVDVGSRVLDGVVRLPRQLLGENPAATREPVRGGRDLLRLFKELKQTVTNEWVGTKPPVVEEDRAFLERKEKMQELETQLTAASQQAEALVKAQQDFGETIGELGLAFIKLTKFESEEAMYNAQHVRAADARCVATAAVKASRFYREANAQTVKHLHTLHEYLGLMLSVHAAFSDRSNALLTVQTLLSELSSLQLRTEKLEAAASKVFGGDKSRLRKIEELKETIKVTEDAKTAALAEYERIKENNRNELERVDREMHDDFLDMLKGFAVNQAGYAEKIASVWEKISEETSRYAKQKD